MGRYDTISGMKKWLLLGVGLVITFVVILGSVLMLVGRQDSKKIDASTETIPGENDSILLNPDGTTKQETVAAPAEQGSSGSFRLIATGDFIAHDAINNRAKDNGTNYSPFLQDMLPYFEKAQLRYCMQATQAGGDAFGISGYPNYNAPTQWVDAMAALKCNMINMASDHSNDKGQGAIDANITAWKKYTDAIKVGQYSTQEEHDTVPYATINGLKIAFLAYTTTSAKPLGNGFGVSMYSQDLAKTQIATAKQAGAQFIVVGMRWGTEYAADNNAAQATEAQFLADQGVDIILGGGPHVMEPVQRLKRIDGGETVVWYSLGNFLHAQLEPETSVNCLGVMDVDLATKKVASLGCLPVYTHYEWPPAEEAKMNLLGRTNFKVVPADQAGELFGKGYMAKKTSLQAQLDRLKTVANKNTEVKILTSADYGL